MSSSTQSINGNAPIDLLRGSKGFINVGLIIPRSTFACPFRWHWAPERWALKECLKRSIGPLHVLLAGCTRISSLFSAAMQYEAKWTTLCFSRSRHSKRDMVIRLPMPRFVLAAASISVSTKDLLPLPSKATTIRLKGLHISQLAHQ